MQCMEDTRKVIQALHGIKVEISNRSQPHFLARSDASTTHIRSLQLLNTAVPVYSKSEMLNLPMTSGCCGKVELQ